ncbi:MAG: aminopeptidase P family protein [Cyanobacteria bacterium P01_H01_bin.15]
MDTQTLQRRRQVLAQHFSDSALLWSGRPASRNFPANTYPFRASSHFLYFAGVALENAVIHLEQGNLTLFYDNPTAASALWHGASADRETVATTIGADEAYPLSELSKFSDAASLPVFDSRTQQQQQTLLQRPLDITQSSRDRQLAAAIVQARLVHDHAAIAEVRRAIAVSIEAHRTGMQITQPGKTEATVRAAMEAVIQQADFSPAYGSIVTVRGEVLHNNIYSNELVNGELLLADVGAETDTGWASDITRTWPVSGKFSSTQQELYEVVLNAHRCVDLIKPSAEYRDIHLDACLAIAEGLVELKILKGNPADLVEQDAHALFFPHGVGHLLGLDVHDMEDLGDLAGYADGRTRSPRFGLGYLRLDRPLQAGMIVTIEPGFYQVPAILQDPKIRDRYQDLVNWERLADFADVRGIRIEDDVLVTETGADVLTAQLPKEPADIEQLCSGP